MLRTRYDPPRDIFPTDPWVFGAVRFDSKLADQFVGQAETMFALSNGYLGMRGMIDEGTPVKDPGVFLNGFYEHRPISYGEHAYGFPRVGQSILNCPDGTTLKLFVDDEPFVLTKAEILSFRRVLAMFLLSDQFMLESKKRNFDYYDPLTTHDSSLSVCIQSIVANEIGYRRRAMRHFNYAAVMDLSDVGGNMMHGAHIASIGGTWLALVYGFAGMRDTDGRISFRPRLPEEWSRLGFPLTIRGQRLRIDIDHAATTYRLIEGERLTIHHDGEEISLTASAPSVSRVTPQAAAEPEPELDACDTARSAPGNGHHGDQAAS